MPLKPCLKAATNLNDQDVETILENFDTYKESMKPKAASIAAIDDAITSAQEERSETLDLVYKTHPGLAPTRFNESQLEKLFNIDNDTTMVSMDLVKGRESVPQDAKDRADFLGLYGTNLSAIDLLAELSREIPEDLKVKFEEISINRRIVKIKVLGESYEAADRLKNILDRSDSFSNAVVDKVKNTRRGKGKRFNLTLNLDSGSQPS